MPAPEFATIAQIQAALMDLLLTREPAFIQYGIRLFIGLATIAIIAQGIKTILAHHAGLTDQIGALAILLLKACGVYGLLVFYDAPIPGVGVSFTNVITDSIASFMSVLDARALENTFHHLDVLWAKFLVPDSWALLSNLMYWTLLLVLTVTKCFALAVVAFGLIASAVCALLGPLFLPWLMFSSLSWMAWGWLKSFISYSFVPVVAMAYLMVFEKFIFAFVTTIPNGIPEASYPLYLLEVAIVVGTFGFGILMVPHLTTSLFSGHVHGASTGLLAVLSRK
jgi:hypothetical protein